MSYIEEVAETVSLCETCYSHVPATIFDNSGSIWLGKTCPTHGYSEHMIERDAEFYYNLTYDKQSEFNFATFGILIEVTDRCNLNCPHCYHEPESKTQDRPIEDIIKQLDSWSKDPAYIVLAGAEPTVRKDLPEVVSSIKEYYSNKGNHNMLISMMTNGIRLNDLDFCEQLEEAGLETVLIGLNHSSYQGEVVHNKQLQGIENCNEVGIQVYYVGYTLEGHEHLEEVLLEIQELGDASFTYRIRCGSDIGRSPEEERLYLSDNVKEIKRIAEKHGWEWEDITGDDNIYHYMVKINGINHRIIQWCDAKTIVMDELNCGPWCDFVPGKPITNFLHQIILRDQAINNGNILLDTVPEKYTFKTVKELGLEG